MHCRSEQSSELTGPILLTSESDIVYFAVGLRRYHGRCQLHHSLAGSVTEPQITCGEPGCRALEVRERRMCAAVYTAITVFAPVNSDAVDCNCCSASRKDKAKGNCCAASLAGNLHVSFLVSSHEHHLSSLWPHLAAPGLLRDLVITSTADCLTQVASVFSLCTLMFKFHCRSVMRRGGRWPFLGHRSAHPGTNAHRPPASLSSRACSTYPARSTMPVTGPWLQPALFPPRKRQRRSLPRRAAKLSQSAVPACVPCSTCSVIRLLCRQTSSCRPFENMTVGHVRPFPSNSTR